MSFDTAFMSHGENVAKIRASFLYIFAAFVHFFRRRRLATRQRHLLFALATIHTKAMVPTSLERLPSRSKRRRVVAAARDDDAAAYRPVYIHDILSGELLKEVATYLTPPSRILFAIAITRPNNTISPMKPSWLEAEGLLKIKRAHHL